MKFHYDKKADALYLRFDDKRYAESDEVAPGVIFDYDRAGRIIGMEVLEASKRFPSAFQASFNKKKIPAVFDIVRKYPVS